MEMKRVASEVGRRLFLILIYQGRDQLIHQWSKVVAQHLIYQRRGWVSRLGVLDPELNLEEKRTEQDVCGRYDKYMHWCQVITNVFLPDIKRKLRDKTNVFGRIRGGFQSSTPVAMDRPD